MMNDVENEVEEQQAEDGPVNRVPELKQLSEDIMHSGSSGSSLRLVFLWLQVV